MLKKLIDTNIFIDRLADQSRFEDLFLAAGQVPLKQTCFLPFLAPLRLKRVPRAGVR
jgi:hypothetical protein